MGPIGLLVRRRQDELCLQLRRKHSEIVWENPFMASSKSMSPLTWRFYSNAPGITPCRHLGSRTRDLHDRQARPRFSTFATRKNASIERRTRPVTVSTSPWFAGQRRSIAITPTRRYANVEGERLDLSRIERESDSVDVCIVGGGESMSCKYFAVRV